MPAEPNFEEYTELELELKICYECLHCTHEQFLRLSKEEKLKAYFYVKMTERRKEYFHKEEVRKRKRKQLEERDRKNRIPKGRA